MPDTGSPETGWSDGLLEAGFGDAPTATSMGWPRRVRRMVEVEAALGRALAHVGIVSAEAGDAIARACDPDRLDLEALAERAATAPTPVIPLVRALGEGADEQAQAWLHHGATSQDVIDTAVVLQVRDALGRLETLLLEVGARCAELAEQHGSTVLAGRTLGQQAVPVTFGLKAARWLGALDRRIEALRWVAPRALAVQLGGAAGTSAVYGPHGILVAEALAEELGLSVPDLPWHAERDRVVELAGVVTAVVTTVEAIATDLVLLAQTEIGEVREGAGSGPGSSAMPHKRNPVHATAARAASRLALGDLAVLQAAGGQHEQERAAGAWQAEWVALPSGLVRSAGAVARLRDALVGLEVDAERARRNLDASLGLTASEALATALTPALGRAPAQALTGELAAAAVAQGEGLREVAAVEPRVREVLDGDALDGVFAGDRALTLVPTLIARALATHEQVVAGDRIAPS